MSETSKSALRYIAETTVGTTPTSPAFRELAFVSSGMAYGADTEVDDSIAADRQILDLSLVGYDVEGDNEHRLRYGALDDLFEAAFYGTWNKRPTLASSAYTASTGTFTVASGGAAFIAGHLIMPTGMAIAANMVARRVASSTGTTVVAGAGVGSNDTASTITVVGIEGASGDITVTGGGSPAIGTTALNFVNLGFVAGMWLKVGGTATANKFNTAANNDWVRVSAVTTTSLALDSVPTGWTTDNGSGKTIRIFMGDFLRNGTTRRSFSFEREYEQDSGSKVYRYFAGCFLGCSISLSAREMVSVSFSTMGMSATTIGARLSGASTLAAVTGDVYNASSNIGNFRMNGTPLAAPNYILGFDVEINNNHRGREAVGTAGYVDVRAGRCEVTGSAESYLGDATMLNALMNNTASSVALPMLAADRASGYHLDIPRLKFTDGGEEISGNDEDIAPNMDFQGLRHSTLGYTVQLSRYLYLEQ